MRRWLRHSTRSLKRQETLTGYVFIAPYLLSTLVFSVGCFSYALVMSFTDQRQLIERSVHFNGLANYQAALSSQSFQQALANITWALVIVIPGQLIGGLGLALLINRRLRGIHLLRSLIYTPAVVSTVSFGLIALLLFLRTGYVNRTLAALGLPSDTVWMNEARSIFEIINGQPSQVDNPWLRGPSLTWLVLMILHMITTLPIAMLIILAGLQNIPQQAYDLAELEGANRWQRFMQVTLPGLRPALLLVILLGAINLLQQFENIVVMTGGGPADTTLTPAYLIYVNVLGRDITGRSGVGYAMAVLLTLLIFAFVVGLYRWLRHAATVNG